jgi:hypothetical protein
MSKFLSGDAVKRYRRDGFYFPVRVLSAAEARGYRDRLETVEREQLEALGRHPVILDAVEDIIGPDILLWSSSFLIKEARARGGTSRGWPGPTSRAASSSTS